jgi:transposase
LDQPVLVIEKQTGISHYSVIRATNILRQIITKDVPGIFSGTVEVDETYLGGQKKNKRKSQLRKEKEIFGKESKRGFGTTKQAVFGILARSGRVFARLVDDTEAKDLIPIIKKKVRRGSHICSDTWRAYTGLATRGYVHRTVEHQKKEYAIGRNHINGLEGFFGYLKRKLAAKGGVRRKYLSLFLGEYVWRYNYRRVDINQKVNHLLRLLENFSG